MGSRIMDPWLLQLEQLTQELFAFLVEEKGFVQRKSDYSAWAISFYYVHYSAQLGLQIQLDFRDGAVDLNLLKLQGRKLPKHEFVVNGEKVRRSLDLFLRDDLHIQDERLDALFALYRSGRRGEQFYAEVLQATSAVVERFINLVLQQPPGVLFPPRRGMPNSAKVVSTDREDADTDSE